MDKIEQVVKENDRILLKEYVYKETVVDEDYLINLFNEKRAVIEGKKKQILEIEEEISEVEDSLAPVEDYLLENDLIELENGD